MRKFENLRDERKFDEGTKFQIFEGPKLNLLKLKIEKGEIGRASCRERVCLAV